VHVVRHDDERVQTDVSRIVRDLLPIPACNVADLRQPQLPLHHLTEEAFTISSTDRDEIPPMRGIIPPFQTGGFDPVSVPIKGHGPGAPALISKPSTSTSPEISLGNSRSRVRRRLVFFSARNWILWKSGETVSEKISSIVGSG
jgi:hypothetical protein